MKTIRDFLNDEGGFEGAEKALLICLGLAVIIAVTAVVRGGAEKAAGAASTALTTQNGLPTQ